MALFLLDDFDGFAAKRAKQTLLYNLLDALQTSGMQVGRVVMFRYSSSVMLEARRRVADQRHAGQQGGRVQRNREVGPFW